MNAVTFTPQLTEQSNHKSKAVNYLPPAESFASHLSDSMSAVAKREDASTVGNRITSLMDRTSISDLLGIEQEKPGVITGADLERAGKKGLADFSRRINDALAKEGIDTRQPIDFGIEPYTGRVIVRNDHPSKDRIEEIVNVETDLRNVYVGATNHLSMVEHGKHAVEFQKAYGIDPVGAVAQFSYLFNQTVDANVTITNGEYEYDYEWVNKR